MVAALALAGGACGGGGDDDDAAEGDETTEDSGGDSADDDGSGGGEWCDLARNVETQGNLLDDIDFTDPESLEDAYQQMIDVTEDAADAAPDEIKDDVELTINFSKELFEALRDVDFDFLEVDQAIFEDTEADAAGERIEAYNERVCGIASDGGGTDDSDTGDTGDSGDSGTDDSDTGDSDTGDSGTDDSGTDDSGTDDSDVDADVTDDTGDDGALPGDGTIRDELLRQFTALGMTEDQANCMVDNLDMEEVASSGAEDPSMFLDLFATCDIDLTDLQAGG